MFDDSPAPPPRRPFDILLVEDNPGDVCLTREVLADAAFETRLHVVGDGVEAMAFLRREVPYGDAPCPALVLLDLDLPRKDGREVLAELKLDPVLHTIPVVVLTTCDGDQDVLHADGHFANGYLTKPVTAGQIWNALTIMLSSARF